MDESLVERLRLASELLFEQTKRHLPNFIDHAHVVGMAAADCHICVALGLAQSDLSPEAS